MYDVDLARFWKDDEAAHQDDCFYTASPQVALGIRMSEECIYAELGVEGNSYELPPRDLRIELNKRYNDKAEKIVGIRLLPEEFPTEDAAFPIMKNLAGVFEGKIINSGGTEWLEKVCDTPFELEKLLDRVDTRRKNLREFVLYYFVLSIALF